MTLSSEQYAAEAGTRCPVCKATSIESTEQVQVDGPNAWQEIRCNLCGSTWNELFRLTGFAELEINGCEHGLVRGLCAPCAALEHGDQQYHMLKDEGRL